MNCFKRHGATLQGPERDILDSAVFGENNILRHEIMADGTFETKKFYNGSTFVSGGKLYYFTTSHSHQIDSFFELNLSREKCLKGENGVYFEFT